MIEQLEGKALEWYSRGKTGFVRIDDLGENREGEDAEVTVSFYEVVKVQVEKISRAELQELLTKTVKTGVIWNQQDMTWYDWNEPAPTTLGGC